jgi:acyl carrier protein phosphodiesterase
MNYLAHAYLSFNRPGILVGNMISDFVKGKKKYDYAPDILTGIDLHRAIDDFTDMHPVTKSARQIFQPVYGLYSGAFMDIAYDYFIANDKQLFEPGSLETFSRDIYDTLDNYTSIFPPRFNQLFPSMKKYNWLLNYRNISGIERSFEGLAYRAVYMSDSEAAFNLFLVNRDKLEYAYRMFFPELIRFTQEAIDNKGL